MVLLSQTEIENALTSLDGWRVKDGGIEKSVEAVSYQIALETLYKVGQLAETLNHHPDMTLSYKILTIRFWTHSVGGVTQQDIETAKLVNTLI